MRHAGENSAHDDPLSEKRSGAMILDRVLVGELETGKRGLRCPDGRSLNAGERRVRLHTTLDLDADARTDGEVAVDGAHLDDVARPRRRIGPHLPNRLGRSGTRRRAFNRSEFVAHRSIMSPTCGRGSNSAENTAEIPPSHREC